MDRLRDFYGEYGHRLGTGVAANSNDGGSVKPSEFAKVYSVAALDVAEATVAKRPQQLRLPFAENDNEE